ncbi:sigma-70 family RNA polymerase sigma factor [Oscillatoria amoena NRMC-F 0135]|nr:sigma-70 family RNA polymerase sigma factor [Oscillatoria amoena NRMC-F 0135]
MTDAEIVNLIKNEDPRGLSTVYESFRSEFVHWLMRLQRCGNEDAREFYQASILILYDNIKAGKLDGLRSSLKTYLFGIGKNLVWQRYRTNHRQEVVSAEFYLKNYLLEDGDSQLDQEINLEIISHSYNQLGEPCHQLLGYYYFQRKNMEEISAIMGYKNPETAKNQKYKCMERLRRMVFGNLQAHQHEPNPVIKE